jgi:hypothetical protein
MRTYQVLTGSLLVSTVNATYSPRPIRQSKRELHAVLSENRARVIPVLGIIR